MGIWRPKSPAAKCRLCGNKNTQPPLLISVSANSPQFAMTAAASEDGTLVRASRAGDVAAFEELVKRYDSKLLRIALHVTHNREDAQDAVQEAFLKAFQKLEQFQENSKFSTWMFRITVNESLMKLRKQRRQREVSIDQDFQAGEDMLPREIADWAPNPEERYRARESREILIEVLQQLEPGLRVVFVLRDIEGLSLEQTAEALDLSVSAVKARSWRARLQLRERLNKYFRKTGDLGRMKAARSGRAIRRMCNSAIADLRDPVPANAQHTSEATKSLEERIAKSQSLSAGRKVPARLAEWTSLLCEVFIYEGAPDMGQLSSRQR
jgi:RNA polymerase sigma-70 factor (ECF subfamily)